ncbi:putative FKBP-type peptidyl-prolyl cis-trans isomerase [compost metagenome]
MNKFTQLSLFTLLLATVIFSSCKKEYESIETIDDAAIQAYLKKNNLSFEKDASGYYYKVTTDGTGDVIKNSDSVYYSYTFKTLSGQVLNQTSNVMIPGTFLGYTDRFTINNVSYVFTPIREVLTKLKRGGNATLIMPSNMAFGKNGISFLNIGSNENILVNLGIYSESKVHQIDELEINNFLSANSLTAIKDPSRVRYIVTQQGTGDQVLASSTLSVNYTGRLLNGNIFDQTSGTALSIDLANAIKGWGILKNFKAGTKIRLFIPSDLGYGQAGNGTIPGNAVLDFDIEIVSVTN